MYKRIPTDFRLPAASLGAGLLLALAAWLLPPLGAVISPVSFAIGGLLGAVFFWAGWLQREAPAARRALHSGCCLPVVDDQVGERAMERGAPAIPDLEEALGGPGPGAAPSGSDRRPGPAPSDRRGRADEQHQ